MILLLCAILLGADPPADKARAGEAPPLRLQVWQVPATNPVDQIRAFLSGEARTLPLEDLKRRLDAYRRAGQQTSPRPALRGRLTARFDPLSRLLEGTGEWEFPAGDSDRVTLAPWNAAIRELKVAGTDGADATGIGWGISPGGGLAVVGLPKSAGVMSARWFLGGVADEDEVTFHWRWPDSALNTLDLEVPTGWTLRTDAPLVEDLGQNRRRIRASGSGELRLQLIRAGGTASARLLSSTLTNYRWDEIKLNVESEIEITLPREGIPSIAIEADRSLISARVESDVPGDWRLMEGDESSIRWIFQPRGWPVSSVHVRVIGTIPNVFDEPVLLPLVRVVDSLSVGEETVLSLPMNLRWTALETGGRRWTNSATLPDGTYEVKFAGGARAPMQVTVARVRPDWTFQPRTVLDLSADPIRVTTRFDIAVRSGEIYQLEASLPARWRLVSVTGEPIEQAPTVRTEPGDADATRVLLGFRTPLSKGRQASIELTAEYGQGMSRITTEQSLPLPEFSLAGAPDSPPAEYEIQLDPLVPCNTDSLPPPIPTAQGPGAGTSYVFHYLPPSSSYSLTLLPSTPRWRATVEQRIRRRADDWRIEVGLEGRLIQGTLESLHIVSSRPFPRDVAWRFVGSDNSVVSFEPFPGAPGAGGEARDQPMMDRAPEEQEDPPEANEYHYLLRTALPIHQQFHLTCEWDWKNPELSVPLLQLPDSEEFRGSIEVASRTGQVIDIQSRGLISTAPDPQSASEDRLGVVWLARFDRLDSSASLELRAEAPAAAADPSSFGRCITRCRTLVEDPQVVHVLAITVDARRVVPLELELAPESYIWQVQLDGVGITPVLSEGTLTVTSALPPGTHDCLVVFSVPARPTWGMTTVTHPAALRGWENFASIWTIQRLRESYLLSTSTMSSRGSLLSTPKLAQLPIIDLSTDGTGRATVAALSAAYTELAPADRARRTQVLSALSRAVPAGGQWLIDRPAGKRTIQQNQSQATLVDWLEDERLVLFVHGRNVVVADEAPTIVAKRLGSNWTTESWVEAVVAEVAEQGADRSGQWSDEVPGERSGENIAPTTWSFALSTDVPLVTWIFTMMDSADASPARVTIVSAELLTRIARLLTFIGILTMLLIGPRLTTVQHRRGLAVLLSLALAAACIGGIPHHVMSVPIWATTATALSVLVFRTWIPFLRLSPAAISLLVMTASTSLGPAEEPTHPYRVLIPVNENGPVGQAIVPEPLLRRLEGAPARTANRAIVRRLQIEGRPGDRDRCSLKAVVDAFVETVDSQSIPLSLAFGDIEPIRTRVDGVLVPFRRPGGMETDLDVTIPAQTEGEADTPGVRAVRVEIEFEAPMVGSPEERTLSLRTPSAAESDLRIVAARPEWVLSARSAAQGWQETMIDGQRLFQLVRGPLDRLELSWREEAAEAVVPAGEVESLQLFSAAAEGGNFVSMFRFSTAGLGRELTWSLPDGPIVVDVTGDSVLSWRVQRDREELATQTLTARVDPTRRPFVDVVIETRVLGGSPAIELPDIKPIGFAGEHGVFALVVPEEWESRVTPAIGIEAAPAAEFTAVWSRLQKDAVPPGIGDVHRFHRRGANERGSFALGIQPRKVKWRVRQQVTARINPRAGMIDGEGEAVAEPVGAPASFMILNVPAGLEIIRLEGADLRDWFRRQDEVVVLLRETTTKPVSISWRFRQPWSPSSEELAKGVSVPLAPIGWQGADLVQNRWRVRAVSGWTLRAAGASVSGVDQRGLENIEVVTSDHEAPLVQVAVDAREIEVDLLTQVLVREREAVFQGTVVVTPRGGPVEQLEFSTPAGLSNLEWEIPNAAAPRSRVEGRIRTWTVPAPPPSMGSFVIRWRTSKFHEAGLVGVPRVSIEGANQSREFVGLVNTTNQALAVRPDGLSRAELPETLRAVAAATVSGSTEIYRADRQDWQLQFQLEQKAEQPFPYRVFWGEHDLIATSQGRISGRSLWQIHDESDGVIEVETPADAQIQLVQVDQEPLALPERAGNLIRIPVFRKGRRQRLVVEWSAINVKDEQLSLPQLRGSAGTSIPTAVRVRHDAGLYPTESKGKIDRADWLLSQVTRRVEELSDRLANPLLPAERPELAALVSRVQGLDLTLQRVLRASATVQTAREGKVVVVPDPSEAVARELNQRVQSFVTAFETDLASAATVVSDSPLRFWRELDLVPVDRTSFFSFESAPASLPFAHGVVWPQRPMSTNEWVRIVTSALALVLVVRKRLWDKTRLYWPAPLIAGGLGWAAFADTYYLGWIVVAVGMAGAVWTLRRWFHQPPLDTPTTLLSRSTRVSHATVAVSGRKP